MRYGKLVRETFLAAQVNPIAVISSLYILDNLQLYKISPFDSGSTIPLGLFLLIFCLLNLAAYLALLQLLYPAYRFLRETLPLGAYIMAANRAHVPFVAAVPFECVIVLYTPEIVMFTILACIYFLAAAVAAIFSIRDFYRIQERLETEAEAGDFLQEQRHYRLLQVLTLPALAGLLWAAPIISIPGFTDRHITMEQSAWKIMEALEQKDADLFLRYVDLDRVLTKARQELPADTTPDKSVVLEYLRQGLYRKAAVLPAPAELDARAAWRPYDVEFMNRNYVYVESLVNGRSEKTRLVFEKRWDRYQVVGINFAELKETIARHQSEIAAANAKYEALMKEPSAYAEVVAESLELRGALVHVKGYALNKADRPWLNAVIGYYLLDNSTGKVIYLHHDYFKQPLKQMGAGEQREIDLRLDVPWPVGKRMAEGQYTLKIIPEKITWE